MVCSQPTSLGNGVNDWGDQSGLGINAKYKTALTIDSSGNKWIGYTSLGVLRFIDNFWIPYNVANGNLPSDSVTSIAINGNIVYVGTKKGIAKYINGNWSIIDTSNSQIISNDINSLFYHNNVLWVGTDKGVSKFNGIVWSSFSTANSQLCNNNVQAIEQTTNGDMFFGTSNGLSKLSGTSWTTYDSINSGLLDDTILSLCSDKANKLYIGTNSKGAYIFNNGTIQSLIEAYPTFINYFYDQNHTNILNSKICNIAKDTSGSIYFSAFVVNIITDIHNNNFFIKIAPTKSNVYVLFPTVYPILFACENTDTLWFVNSNMGNGATILSNLYSFILSDGDQRDDYNSLDINNVKAGISSSGYLFNDYVNSTTPTYFLVPKDSVKSTIYCGSLWLGAKDNTGNLHLAAERYRGSGTDYQAGPYCNDTNDYNLDKDKWNHVWKVSQSEINYHKLNYNNTGYVMPTDIATWPGNGNPAYGQSPYLAPYVDANSNGIYDPQNGDYPIIRGDQALYFIFNDDKVHGETSGIRMLAEIHGMAYAFNAPNDTALNNTIFINYRVYNRSQNNYDSLYISSFTDLDIGYAFDDYIGCDTILSMYYAYNGKKLDGQGESWAYLDNPPAQAVVFLNNQMSSFMMHINANTGPTTDPSVAIEYYNFMQAIWKDNTHLFYGGDGYFSSPGTTNIPTNYAFSGDPSDTTAWSEVSANMAPADVRGIGTIGPFSFGLNACHCIDIAYTYADKIDDTVPAASVTLLKQHVQHVKDYYNTNMVHDCSDLFCSVKNIIEIKPEVFVYPNPASNVVNIITKGFTYKKTLKLTDIQGRLIWIRNYTEDNIHINVQNLTKGIYILQINDQDKMVTKKIVKQ